MYGLYLVCSTHPLSRTGVRKGSMESTGTDDNGSVQEYSFSLEFASPTAAGVGPGVVLAGLHGSMNCWCNIWSTPSRDPIDVLAFTLPRG